MIRRIRDLLYDQGFTISGARNKMQEIVQAERDKKRNGEVMLDGVDVVEVSDSEIDEFDEPAFENTSGSAFSVGAEQIMQMRRELFEIRDLLSVGTRL